MPSTTSPPESRQPPGLPQPPLPPGEVPGARRPFELGVPDPLPVPAGPEAAGPSPPAANARPGFAFMRRHPAHWLAFGFGSGLAPRAPGTVGTLWAWVAFLVLDPWLGAAGWALVIPLACAAGIWAATRTAQNLRSADPGAIVWDEVVAFWLVLWLLTPAPWWAQAAAFALFRYFDIAKPGPVRWADRLFKPARAAAGAPSAIGWRQGLGIMFDDLVAAGCTLVFIALWIRLWNS